MNSAVFSDPAFWLLVIFVIPLIIRVPIAVALGFSALVIVWGWDMGIGMISYNFFAGVAKFPLLAIPFFILAGYIMERAGIAARIIELMEALVGDKTGGLAVASVAVCTFWGAVSGSGPATVAALGLVLIPGMVKAGYDKPSPHRPPPSPRVSPSSSLRASPLLCTAASQMSLFRPCLQAASSPAWSSPALFSPLS